MTAPARAAAPAATAGTATSTNAAAPAATRPPLRLCARDADDLAVVAACLQDARIPPREMAYAAAEGRFMAAFTRFQRERLPDPAPCTGLTQSRAALVFQRVGAVRHRGLDGVDDDAELELLTIAVDGPAQGPKQVTLVFAGDAAIRLSVEAIDCCLEDFGEAWPAKVMPCDHFAAAAAAPAPAPAAATAEG